MWPARLLSAYQNQVAYTLGMNAIIQTAARLVNEEVIELICSHGDSSLAAQLRMCLTCDLSCPGSRNCPVITLKRSGAFSASTPIGLVQA